jgi:phosphatidylethanolamine/phosphatidyl-N-methylethanolamine N-methyltransferase
VFFTKKILQQLPDDAKLLVFELNQNFYNLLNNNFDDERVIFINDSAEKIGEYIKKEGYLYADYIVSSLPLANFPKKLSETIINESYNYLKNHGKFIQFQYSLFSKKVLENKFQSIHISFTPINFPPAFVYTCLKEK